MNENDFDFPADGLRRRTTMPPKKQTPPKEKSKLHPRNRHRKRYDFKALIGTCPELAPFVARNRYDDDTIDFANPKAVLLLNKALLKHFYGIENWDIPLNYLCPPIPGRADYIHYIADLLAASNNGKIPTGQKIKCFDIGVGANCVYPIIGHKEYGWSFIGSEIDPVAISAANKIIAANPTLKTAIECRLQPNPKDIFRGIIRNDERYCLTICNPPFHASLAEAQAGTLRKLSNLSQRKITKPTLNFGGKNRELWVEGGEEKFVGNMIRESSEFSNSCFWFSTLISKQASLKSVYAVLKQVEASEVKTIPMAQGNKISRIVAWTFLTKKQQNVWENTMWRKR